MSWTKADIRSKIRRVTARLSPNQITDTELDTYIDNYYEYTFPAELKLDRNLDYYEFLTQPNVEYYNFPINFTNFQPPMWINGWNIAYFTNPAYYYSWNPDIYTRRTLGAGDGTTLSFSQAAQNYPIISGSVIVSDGIETFTDNGSGVLTGDLGGTGTVNYTDASLSVTFFTAPTNGTVIYLTYLPYRSGQPQAVLLFDNQFRLYPIPDMAYHVKIVGFSVPPAMATSASEPLLPEWGPTIAYGAAREIFADNGEMDRVAEIEVLYRRELKYILRRTLENSVYERAIPIN